MGARETFTAGMTMLGTTFNRPLDRVLLDAYWGALAELSDEEMKRAIGQAMMRCRSMPVPAELLAFAGRAPRGVAGDAVEAWEAVRRAIDVYDYTDGVDFGPLVNAVVRNIGGWQR